MLEMLCQLDKIQYYKIDKIIVLQTPEARRNFVFE